MATVLGSASFCVTFVPGIAYFLNYGCRKARPPPSQEEQVQNRSLLKSFARDMTFIILGLLLFYCDLVHGTLNVFQCLILLLLFGVYVGVLWL